MATVAGATANGVTVSVTSTSDATGAALSALQNAIDNQPTQLYVVGGNNTPTITGATLVIPPGLTGQITIPGGYSNVVVDDTGVTLTGGDTNTTIVSGGGNVTYIGPAAEVVAVGGNANITDPTTNAHIAVDGNGNTVNTSGSNARVDVSSDGSAVVHESGANSTYKVGEAIQNAPTGEAAAVPADASVAGAMSTFMLTSGNSILLADSTTGDSSYIILNGGANTISAQTDTSTISALTGGDVYFGSFNAATLFVGATSSISAAVSTIFGGGGNSTVFGEAGVAYTEGAGNNLYVGGIASALAAGGVASASMAISTITATTGNDTIFGGTVGTIVNLGQGSELFVGQGASDTLTGGSIAPTVFGNTNEDVKLIGTATGGILVAQGAADTIDASLGGQHNAFFVNNAVGNGNTTLIGALAAPGASVGSGDIFVVSSVAGAATVAHTITIADFQTNDAFFLSGYSAADNAAFAAKVASTPAGSPLSVTLSDNTTISFVGNHPTNTFNGGTTVT